jgi:hypothetical protein
VAGLAQAPGRRGDVHGLVAQLVGGDEQHAHRVRPYPGAGGHAAPAGRAAPMQLSLSHSSQGVWRM